MIIKDSNLDVDNDVVISTAQHLFTDKNPEAFLDAYAKLDDTQKFFTLLTVLDASDDITKPIFKKTLANLSSDLIDIKTWNKVGANKDNQLKIFSMVTEIGNSLSL